MTIDIGSAGKAFAAIPLLGSLFAVTYDVGYFWGIDPAFFGFFSLAEHIVFAAQAIPLAALVAIAMFWSAQWLVAYAEKESGAAQKQSSDKRKSRIDGLFFWFFIIMIPANLIFGSYETAIFLITVVASTYAVRKLGYRSIERALMEWLILALCFTFTIGSAVGRFQTGIVEPTHKIVLKAGGTLDGRVLRAGERGFLFYKQAARHVTFIQSSDVASVERTARIRYPSLICIFLPRNVVTCAE